ncbi:MAG: hypothetical protein KAG66_09200, partial [Methylococcales bacterium]|nr:hypothetical protein [Methylococcales bacterium]
MSYFDDISIYDDDDDELETQPVTQVEPVEPAPSSGYYANYMEAYGDDNKEGSFTKALGAGLVDDTKSTYYAVKSLFTDDELDRQRAIQISDRSPAGESFVDAYNEGDAGKAWSATKNAVGRGLGNIAPMIAGGGVGGMAAKGAGMSVKAGVTAGAMASSAPQNMGEAIRSIDDKGAAIAAGTVNTMLDALPVMGVVNKLGLGKKVTGEVTDSVIKKFGKAGLEGMAKEGATEALQEFVIDATKYSIGESKELMSDDNIKKWIDSGVGGALVGGAITSSASVLGGQGSTAANPDTDISQAPEGSYASALETITPEPTFDPTIQAEPVTNETSPAPIVVESMGEPAQAMINDKGANRPMSDVISELSLKDPKEAMAQADELQKGLPIDDKRALY